MTENHFRVGRKLKNMIRRISVIGVIKNFKELLAYMQKHGQDIHDSGETVKIMLFPSIDEKTITMLSFFADMNAYNRYLENHLEKLGADFKKNVLDAGLGTVVQPGYACNNAIEIF